jgi:hypothetical protein
MVMKMKCPYLSVASEKRVCRLMEEQGLDGELDEFDLAHYCKGNPNYCYFYRSCGVQKTTDEQIEDSKSEKIQVVFFDKPSKLKLGEAEISVSHNDLYPLNFKLIKRGFRHRVKPELVENRVVRVTKEEW